MFSKLKIINLSIFTDNKILLENINLVIKQGQPLVLLGESGSGKSLIIDAVMGSLDSKLNLKGEIFLDDLDLLRLSNKQRRALWGKKIALLPQEPSRALDPTMKIVNQVSEVHQYIHKRGKKKSYKHSLKDLEDVSLDSFEDSYPFELSGGMCQRLTIAITHASNAQVLLADEPTKGLDQALCKSVAKRLNEEVNANRLLFVVTHDIEVAKYIKGTLGVIVDGKLVEYNTHKNIFTNPQHPYTKKLLQSDSSNWEIEKAKESNQILIEAKNISKTYGENKLYENLYITLKKGEITSIVGKSGCGKSTLGDILLGIKKPTKGKVITSILSPIQLQKIYQDPPSAFLPHQTLLEGFEDLIKLHKLCMHMLYDWFNKMKLDRELLNRKPSEVSGGQLQRMAIIRVLLLKPSIIFADEITSRLDPITQQEIIYLLVDIVKKEQLSLLLITHDLQIAQKISNKIIQL